MLSEFVDVERKQRDCCSIWLYTSGKDGCWCSSKSGVAMGDPSGRHDRLHRLDCAPYLLSKLNRAKFAVLLAEMGSDLPVPPSRLSRRGRSQRSSRRILGSAQFVRKRARKEGTRENASCRAAVSVPSIRTTPATVGNGNSRRGKLGQSKW